MIIASRKLQRLSTLSLLAALTFIGGCGWLAPESAPLIYTRVATVAGLADISEPFGIFVKDDVIYLSDGETGTIRRIGSDGNATTVASGLNTPSAIAFLPNGNLVVADTGSHTIKEITHDGAITIIAGVEGMHGASDGPVLSATFNGPIGLAVNADGSIYVADTYNDRIRLIKDGMVSAVAGSIRGFSDGIGPAAMFDTPLGLAVWGDDIVVADSGNARIRIVERGGIVHTLAGSAERDLIDGSLSTASFEGPSAITIDTVGRMFVADGNAIRVIGQRVFPFVETLAGDRRGYLDGNRRSARFNRPSGLAVGPHGQLYIADSDNGIVRVITDGNDLRAEETQTSFRPGDEPLPLATRWPFDPPSASREIAGTLGEIRGEIKPDGRPVWFHNGLDVAGAYGETTRFIRDETVLDPHSAENFGTSRELLRLPLLGYIHLRLGRDKDDRPFDDPGFQFERDLSGKLTGVRVPRGAKFSAGDAIGTLNAMNHIHLIAGRSGREINALSALQLPGISDSISPVIDNISLFTTEWLELKPETKTGRIQMVDKTRIVVRAYDRMDGNSERRRLGVYRVGYQLFSGDSPLGDPVWPMTFDRMPSNDAVHFAYTDGSQSGYTPNTIFDYIATNRVNGDSFGEGFLDTTTLAPGSYKIRVFTADYFGNVSSRDIEVMK